MKYPTQNVEGQCAREISEVTQFSISISGDFHLGQTPVICKYLGEKFGLVPKSEEEKWQAEQVNATIHDFVAEGKFGA